jgi:PhzF family phenazine biosynthesis protein
MRRITYQIDSFTKERFKGNPAGVVLNADGLTEHQMLLIARELNNSETAFLMSADNNDCDVVIRYFTPKVEVPICGHATIAALYALATEKKLDSCVLKMKTKVGVLPFEIINKESDYQIVMTQGEFTLGAEFDKDVIQKLLQALQLENADLDDRCPIQIASTGHSKVMIGIKSRNKLNSLMPNNQALIELSALIKCNGFFVFTFDTNNKNVLTNGRMFAPAIGINEDPVTGNANGPLGGYLIQNKIVKSNGNLFEFSAMQGEAIDRLGTMQVSVTVENDLPVLIRIKGDATVIFRTEIEL